MKKKGGIFILILALLLIVFAFFTSSVGASYIANYGYNFRANLRTILEAINFPIGGELEVFLNKYEEEQPQTEYDRLKLEYEKEQQAQEDETDKQTEIDNEEYNQTTIKRTGKNIALENAASSRYSRYSNGIICVSETHLSFYTKNAVKKWTQNLQISSPVLRVNENYILVFEKKGNKFSLYKGKKNIYTAKVDGTIKTASVSAAGDAVIVFDRDGYKGSVAVFNKSGEEVYLWNSGTYSILDADISKERRLAVSLLDASAAISSKVYLFDIDKTEVDNTVDLNNTLVFDIAFDGELLNAYADGKVVGITSGGKVKWTYDTKDKNLTKYTMTPGGTKAMVFDNSNNSEIAIVSASGSEKDIIKAEVLPDFIDVADGRLLYNDARTIIVTNLSGKVLAKYTCSRDIKKVYIIDSNNIFIVYASSIEFLNLKGE